ncbi:MAG: DUF4173 domain-containing protein, partial [Mesorhizobium sp.]
MTDLLAPAPSYCQRFGVAVLLVALADFFFYGQPAGITWFLFGIVLAAAIVALNSLSLNSMNLNDRWLWVRPAALLAALLPLVENVSPLSVSIALVALSAFALSLTGRLRAGLARIARQLSAFFIAAPFRLV